MTTPPPSPLPAVSPADPVAPHPVLDRYYRVPDERRSFVDRIFDETSVDYDRVERFFGLGTGSWYRRQALQRAGLGPGMSVIDVGTGTGLLAREAIALIGDPALLTGVDPSAGMMAQARLPDGAHLLQGMGEAIPLPDADADFVTMGFALRHLASLGAAFGEFRRVLRPGGRVCILELTRPTSRIAGYALKAYMRSVVPTLARVMSRSRRTAEMWRYYWDTIEACVPPDAVLQALRDAGFEQVRRNVEIGLFSEYTALRP